MTVVVAYVKCAKEIKEVYMSYLRPADFPHTRNVDDDLREIVKQSKKASGYLKSLDDKFLDYLEGLKESGELDSMLVNAINSGTLVVATVPYKGLEPCDNTGNSDTTERLQKYIDMATTDRKWLYLPAGQYTVSQAGTNSTGVGSPRPYCLTVHSNTNIIGYENNTVITATDYIQGDVITNDRSDQNKQNNIVLSNISVTMQNSYIPDSGYFGIWFYNCSNSFLYNVRSENNSSWNLRIEKCNNLYITNFRSFHSARTNNGDCLHIVDSSYINVNGGYTYSVSDDIIAIEAKNTNCTNINILNCKIEENNTLSLPANCIRIFTSDDFYVKSVSIKNCVMQSKSYAGVLIGGNVRNSNIEVLGNFKYGVAYGEGRNEYNNININGNAQVFVLNPNATTVSNNIKINGIGMQAINGAFYYSNIDILFENTTGSNFLTLSGQGNRITPLCRGTGASMIFNTILSNISLQHAVQGSSIQINGTSNYVRGISTIVPTDGGTTNNIDVYTPS